MTKPKFETPDMTQKNIDKIAQLFPNCITETKDESGNLKKAVNIELLQQMLSDEIADKDEAYEFTWVGKKAAIVEANKPIRKTLRPCKEESVNWDTTENLYIEGDNLEVLKLLQESYLGKVKMIYIDPPYNTGKDSFIYSDDFSMDADEYDELIEYKDEEGNIRFKQNNATNPRFHSSWCSMIYSRLLLARNLLSDDGFIFISIDDSEASQLKKICDEVFGESNYQNTNYIQVRYSDKTLTSDMNYHKQIEQVLIYGKSENAKPYLKPTPYDYDKFNFEIKELSKGKEITLGGKRVEIFTKEQYKIIKKEIGTKDGLKEIWATGSILNGNSSGRFFRDYLNNRKSKDGLGILYKVYDIGDDQYPYRYFTGPQKENATKGKYYQGVPTEKLTEDAKKTTPIPNFYDMAGDFGNIRLEGGVAFNGGKKPIKLINLYLDYFNDKDFIVLDFFSGSSSTAHAVINKNASDGGKRKFIMVQIPEKCEEGTDAFNEGYKNICEIGKERIRRAGKQILELRLENLEKEGVIEKYARELSEIRSLEEVYGCGGTSVSASQETSKGGALCSVRSDETGGRIHSVKHSGRAVSREQGIYPVFENSKGLTGRAGNTIVDLCTLEILNNFGYRINFGTAGRNKQDALFPDEDSNTENLELLSSKLSVLNSDIGFRVLKIDDSNMKDVYYSASEYDQSNLDMFESNIKEDRNDLDLLFGCLLDWGLPLSLPYTSETMGKYTVHTYNEGDLVASLMRMFQKKS